MPQRFVEVRKHLKKKRRKKKVVASNCSERNTNVKRARIEKSSEVITPGKKLDEKGRE